MEKNEHNLKKAIGKIPCLIPDKERLWEKIEHKISEDQYIEKNRKMLTQAINDIPLVIPEKELLWQKIEKRTSHSIKSRNRIRWTYYAASLVLLLAALTIYFIHNESLNNKSISYSKEIININVGQNSQESKSSSDVEELIARLCKEKPKQCENPDFEQLNNELDKLKIEKQKITREVLLNNDPEAVKYNEMIDKQINQLNNRILDFLKM